MPFESNDHKVNITSRNRSNCFPDIDVTEDFKRVQIKPFEVYMDNAMNQTMEGKGEISDVIS